MSAGYFARTSDQTTHYDYGSSINAFLQTAFIYPDSDYPTDSQTITTLTQSSGTATATFALKTAGTQTVTVTDTTNSIAGSVSIQVNPGAAVRFALTGAPSATTAGVPINLTVTALDLVNNTATGFRSLAKASVLTPVSRARANDAEPWLAI